MEIFKRILVVTLPVLLFVNLVLATQLYLGEYYGPLTAMEKLFGVYDYKVPFVSHQELFDKFTENYFFPNLKNRLEVIGLYMTGLVVQFQNGFDFADVIGGLGMILVIMFETAHLVFDIIADIINLLLFIINTLTVGDFYNYVIDLPF